ncbi:hypothetical protein AB0M28_12740 [Streptomyces sp. NPDC051940]|uniref:hypothetical protein n=1 Tax=Streptomyces sp. NPDC051940 TaxID=3155675 RepID=UPI003423E210
MLAFAAFVLFGIAWILHITETTVDAEIFSTWSVVFLGLALLALHLGGVGTTWSGRRWSRRR